MLKHYNVTECFAPKDSAELPHTGFMPGYFSQRVNEGYSMSCITKFGCRHLCEVCAKLTAVACFWGTRTCERIPFRFFKFQDLAAKTFEIEGVGEMGA